MTVLSIIAVLVAALTLYGFIITINQYTNNKFSFEFFSWGNYAASAIGYASIIYGYNWYEDVLLKGGDLLNGQLLMSIGALLVLSVVYNNIKKSSLLFGIPMSFIQQMLYIPLTIVGFLALFGLFVFASQTRPVYNINKE